MNSTEKKRRKPAAKNPNNRKKSTSSQKKTQSKIQSRENFSRNPQSHTPEQDLELFGTWVGKPIWVPPNDSSKELAKSMLSRFGPFASKKKCWDTILRKHRSQFTQVREFELPKASIRLPQGRLFVTVTEQENFDTIEETIPDCVQTRLDEFLAGPGKKRGVKVYYLKPLCVEVGSDLIFTTSEELQQCIAEIQEQVFAEYRRGYPLHLMRKFAIGTVDAALAVPRAFVRTVFERKKREIEAYHAKMEFERRRRAMETARFHNGYRNDKTSFEEIIDLSEPPKREDVIEHYVQEQELNRLEREMFLMVSAASLPWFATLSLAALKLTTIALGTTVSVALCDPAFVAQMPGSNGKLLKIGHFDEVDGVMHVEI